ncbi:MAG TPA: DUF5701 family protein [Nocardioidaceae bacterium]
MSWADKELDRQISTVHRLGYPALAGLTAADFDERLAPLRDMAVSLPTPSDGDGRIPLLLVVRHDLVPTTAAVERWTVHGRTGWTDMAEELADYRPIEGVDVPDAPAYLLLDVDTGRQTLGVAPEDALPQILDAGRTPLTIDEGVALVTQRPEVFTTHNAFQAIGSRAPNRRVPSLWVSKGAPRLGWCWAGNPHSWLGAASAGARLAG